MLEDIPMPKEEPIIKTTPPPLLKAVSSDWKPNKVKKLKRKSKELKPKLKNNFMTPKTPVEEVKDTIK